MYTTRYILDVAQLVGLPTGRQGAPFSLPAEAAAKEQELQRETLSDQVLRKLWLDKWDGHLPTTLLGSDNQTILQLP